MVPADKYMSNDLVFEVFRDPLSLMMFSKGFSSTITKSKDLIGEFNGKIFSSSSSNTIVSDIPNTFSLIRSLDEDDDLDFRQDNSKETDTVFDIIENDYQSIISNFRSYKMPDHMIKLFTKKIISVTLEHHNKSLINYFEEK